MQTVGSLNAWRRRQRSSAFRSSDLMVVLGLFLSLLFMQLPSGVSGHGYLIDPPQRSSEWRLGFQNPMNVDDNALNCGGFAKQWNENGGKCGVCGDPWDAAPPRPNEVGGTYGNGIIVRQYTVGQVIDTSITMTATHKGWFEFRLCCGDESVDAPTTQECLDANLLEVIDGITSTRYQLPADAKAGSYMVKVKLPAGLAAPHCVLQWKSHSGNNWDEGSDGVGCLGCGPQEEFINCADISISDSDSPAAQGNGSPSPKSTTSITPIASPGPRTRTIPSQIAIASSTTSMAALLTPRTPHNIPTISVKVPSAAGCVAIGLFQGDKGMDDWCNTHCPLNDCPTTLCKCDKGGSQKDFTTCKSVGAWKSDDMDKWCVSNCAGGNCPPDHCQC